MSTIGTTPPLADDHVITGLLGGAQPRGIPPSPGQTVVDQEALTTAAALVLVQRCAWTLVWLAVLSTSVDYWGAWSVDPVVAVLSPVFVLVSLTGAALVWIVRRPLSPAMQGAGLLVALAVATASQATSISQRRFYTTDSAAFNDVATRAFVAGRNPYTTSMAAAAHLLRPAYQYWTYQLDGGHALGVSYPAGSFLLQAPFDALGLHHMVTDWVDLGAWLVAVVLVFAMLPSFLRWLAPLLLLTAVFAGAFGNGGTDGLFLPFLVVAVWRWDRYPGRAVAWLPAWVGPVCLGVACSIKQTPWFCVPFLVIGVACESRRAGGSPVATALRYAGLVVATFVLVDLPFIVWSPVAWLKGALLPIASPLIPDGQGLIAVAIHGLTGGVVLTWMSAASVLALVAMLAAFALWEPRLKRSWLFLVPLVLFLPDRSLSSYLVDFVPVALVAAVSVTVDRAPDRAGARRPGAAALAVGLPAMASLVLLVVAFTSAPLAVGVRGFAVAPDAVDGFNFASLEVTVHNGYPAAVTPHFMVSSGGGHPSGFWRATVVHGTLPVAPGATTEFTLRPSNATPAPATGQWWLVDAYTTSPDALSTSPLQHWSSPKGGH
ncbi:MAG: hypothetical protein ABSF84_05365 [Acidimicrobiales bacterium]